MLAATISIVHDRPNADRRSGDERASIVQPSTLRDERGTPRTVTIDDLSSTGCRLTSADHFPVDARVQIGLSGAGRVEAQVVRRDGDVHGCVFLQPLSADRIGRAFKESVLVAGPFARSEEAAVLADDPERWPGAVRLAVVLGAGTGAWALALGLGRLLLG